MPLGGDVVSNAYLCVAVVMRFRCGSGAETAGRSRRGFGVCAMLTQSSAPQDR